MANDSSAHDPAGGAAPCSSDSGDAVGSPWAPPPTPARSVDDRDGRARQGRSGGDQPGEDQQVSAPGVPPPDSGQRVGQLSASGDAGQTVTAPQPATAPPPYGAGLPRYAGPPPTAGLPPAAGLPRYAGPPTYAGPPPHLWPPPHAGPPPYGGWPGAAARPPQPPGPGAAPYPFGGTPTAQFPGPAGPPRRAGLGVAGVLAVALVAALLGGGVGGAVGVSATGDGGSSGVLGQPLPAADASSAPLGPVEAVADRVLPSVVQLRVSGSGEEGEGSGMVLSADGLLLTNNHVVEAAANGGSIVAVFQDGTTAPAQIVGRDPNSDIAVIRAQNVSGLTPIALGNSESVRVGQQVVAFGSPLGLGGTVTTGIISALDRAVSVDGDTADAATVFNALQTDAAINPGNSGGPLVDMQGQVVGINSAIATTGAEGGSIGVGFSIPINQAQRVAGELERTGRAARAVLGVSVGDDPQRTGALIGTVTPGGAAEKAGIRQGDLVLRFGDQRISTGEDLQAAVASRAPGEVVEIQLGDRVVSATLAEMPG